MTATVTPRQVFDRLSAGISSGNWSQLADLYAEDVVVEMPFALPEAVRLRGRAEVRRHFARNAAAPISLRARNVRVHETADPEVIVAEYDYDVTVGHVAAAADGVADSGTAGGVRLPNVQVLRVRGGLIVESRDYHHHVALRSAILGG
jgi:ketosteroid isomerase-like protein